MTYKPQYQYASSSHHQAYVYHVSFRSYILFLRYRAETKKVSNCCSIFRSCDLDLYSTILNINRLPPLTTNCAEAKSCRLDNIHHIISRVRLYRNSAKKAAFALQPQVIMFTSCLPMVSSSFWVLLPPLKTGCHDIAELLLKVALNTINQSINQQYNYKT